MVDCQCLECGTTFQRYQSQVAAGGGQYCSRACVGKSKRHGSALFCAYCDSEFYRRFGEQDVGVTVRQFCSRPCYMAWRSENMKDSTYPKIGARHAHRIVAESVMGRSLLPDEVVPDQSTHVRCHSGAMSDEELQRFSLDQDPR